MLSPLLVYRLAYNGDVVAFKMGRWQGGPSRTGGRGRMSKSIRNRRATQPPAHFQTQSSGPRPVGCFSALLARPVSIQIWALYRQSGSDRLERQPTDLRRHPHYMRDGALAVGVVG